MKPNYYLVVICTLLVIPTLISGSYAGTTMQNLTQSTKIITASSPSSNMEKNERILSQIKARKNDKKFVNEEFDRWIHSLVEQEDRSGNAVDNTEILKFVLKLKDDYSKGKDIGAYVYAGSYQIN